MKDIIIGLIIILAIFLLGDFIYAEKNICIRGEAGHVGEKSKCGLIKKEFDINIYLFDRYW